jgi:hypothetical protein
MLPAKREKESERGGKERERTRKVSDIYAKKASHFIMKEKDRQ